MSPVPKRPRRFSDKVKIDDSSPDESEKNPDFLENKESTDQTKDLDKIAQVEQELLHEAQKQNGNVNFDAIASMLAPLFNQQGENFDKATATSASKPVYQDSVDVVAAVAAAAAAAAGNNAGGPNSSNDTVKTSTHDQNVYDPELYDEELESVMTAGTVVHDVLLHSLPALDSFALQLLQLLAKGTHEDTLLLVTMPNTQAGQAYEVLKSMFIQVRRLYSTEPFLDPVQLNLNTRDVVGPILRANLATFVISVFGSSEVGFFHLNEHFLDIFCPRGSRLLKSHASLYLDLKTQAYISAVSTAQRGRMDILNDLFSDTLERQLKQRRRSKKLSTVEEDFVRRVYGRRDHIAMCESLEELVEKFPWQTFLKNISDYVVRNHQMVVLQGCNVSLRNSFDDKTDNEMEESTRDSEVPKKENMPPDRSNTSQKNYEIHRQLIGSAMSSADETPTALLYEEAKRKSLVASKGSRFVRRPWSHEEEQALLEGLDRVKGPFWAEILKLYGPGGTINEILKDRNQVQLKDKARNLKLYFLKNQLEVPVNLRYCTGEVRNIVSQST